MMRVPLYTYNQPNSIYNKIANRNRNDRYLGHYCRPSDSRVFNEIFELQDWFHSHPNDYRIANKLFDQWNTLQTQMAKKRNLDGITFICLMASQQDIMAELKHHLKNCKRKEKNLNKPHHEA